MKLIPSKLFLDTCSIDIIMPGTCGASQLFAGTCGPGIVMFNMECFIDFDIGGEKVEKSPDL